MPGKGIHDAIFYKMTYDGTVWSRRKKIVYGFCQSRKSFWLCSERNNL